MAEELRPRAQAAVWRDRAEAAAALVDELDLRDLRSVVNAAGDAGRDEEARALAAQLREALANRVEKEHAAWLADLAETVQAGRVVRALRLSSRPPKAGAPIPGDIATQLAEATAASLTEETAPDRWATVLDALAYSPVRRRVIPQSLPTKLSPDLRTTIARLASRLPEIAHIFDIEPDPAAERAARRPGPPSHRWPQGPGAQGRRRAQGRRPQERWSGPRRAQGRRRQAPRRAQGRRQGRRALEPRRRRRHTGHRGCGAHHGRADQRSSGQRGHHARGAGQRGDLDRSSGQRGHLARGSRQRGHLARGSRQRSHAEAPANEVTSTEAPARGHHAEAPAKDAPADEAPAEARQGATPEAPANEATTPEAPADDAPATTEAETAAPEPAAESSAAPSTGEAAPATNGGATATAANGDDATVSQPSDAADA